MTRFGWASREFTPERPGQVFGQMHVRIAREAKDPLTLTALAIDADSPTSRAVWIACDLCLIPESLQQGVRQRLAHRLPEVPADGIILSATHTHDGPVLEDGPYPHPGADVMTPKECCDRVADRAAEAAVAAWESRAPGRVGHVFAHAVVGHNRRAVYADGTAVMYGKTDRPDFQCIEGYEDHSLDILPIWDDGARLTGLVLDIPCPSQVEENLSQWSADYWHDVRLDLRSRFGEHLHILPLCGAAGDQSPHFLLYGPQEQEMRDRRGLSERQEIARRVGQAVADALACTSPHPGQIAAGHVVRRLVLPGRSITLRERDWARDRLDQATASRMDLDLWWPQRLRQVLECFEKDRSLPPVPIEVHALRIGQAVLATNPFELYLDYGLRIKAQSPAAQTLVVQLAAGSGWYLPTERAVNGGHYGAHPAVAPVGPEGGRMLVNETLQAIREICAAASSIHRIHQHEASTLGMARPNTGRSRRWCKGSHPGRCPWPLQRPSRRRRADRPALPGLVGGARHPLSFLPLKRPHTRSTMHLACHRKTPGPARSSTRRPCIFMREVQAGSAPLSTAHLFSCSPAPITPTVSARSHTGDTGADGTAPPSPRTRAARPAGRESCR